MPDALVRRLRAKGGVSDTIKRALGRKRIDGTAVHEHVHAFYAGWTPDVELADGIDYSFRLIAACDDEATADQLGDALRTLTSGFRGHPVSNGIIMEAPLVELADNITLANIRGLMRFGEWDSLSGPDELISTLTVP